MDESTKKIIDQIEENSHISVHEIYRIANSIQNEDLRDEATVRSLVRQLSRLAGRPISPEKENDIVRSIIQNEIPSSMESLQRFFGN